MDVVWVLGGLRQTESLLVKEQVGLEVGKGAAPASPPPTLFAAGVANCLLDGAVRSRD